MAMDPTQAGGDRPRRRRYDASFKRAVVEQTLMPGTSVAGVAREHGINANQLFKWRRQFLAEGAMAGAVESGGRSSVSLVPVTVVDEPAGQHSAVAGADVPCIEITLPGGEVRIRGAVDGATLRVVLSSLRG